jgi:mono/diheme cytochrome c family protein
MMLRHAAALGLAAAVLAPWPATAWADTPADLLAAYSAKAGAPAQPDKGQKFFTTNFGREMGLSCSSCHGATPVRAGRDVVTEKPIAPLAPAANARRFSDRSKVEFWFGQNCKDVVGRECTAAEKADLISWLMTLKP